MDRETTLKEIAVELTTLTGEIVRATRTDNWTHYLSLPNGNQIACHLEEKHCGFWASKPVGCTRYVGTAPEIHASSTRTPAAIAQDIVRRLYPKALEYWT
jgi:hypothetical protein